MLLHTNNNNNKKYRLTRTETLAPRKQHVGETKKWKEVIDRDDQVKITRALKTVCDLVNNLKKSTY